MKYLLSILLLTLTLQAQWVVPKRSAAFTAAAPSSCATSDTTLPHDTFLEGFNGSGYENTWSEGGSSGTPNEDADTSSKSSGKPTGACDEGFYSTYNASSQYASHDLGSTIDLDTVSLDVYLYIWVQDTTAQTVVVGQWGASATPATSPAGLLRLGNTSGTVSLHVQCATGANSSNVTITENAWHKVKIHFDTTRENSYLQVDDGSNATFTRNLNVDVRYGILGCSSGSTSGESGNLYYDLYALHTP